MSAAPIAITAQEVAKGLSMFEIDESLEVLVEAAEQDAEANNGEISEDIKIALVTYAEAFGYKVDPHCELPEGPESGSGDCSTGGGPLPSTVQGSREP